MYTLSGLLRHHPPAVARFIQLQGWSSLNSSLSDPSIALRRKTAFLIATLFTNATHENEAVLYLEAANGAGVVDTLLHSLGSETHQPTGPDGEMEEIDEDYREKATGALVALVAKCGGVKRLTEQQREGLKELVSEAKREGRVPADLASEEWDAFVVAVQA